MSVPDFQSIIRPLLAYARDGKERTVREAIDSLAGVFRLSDEDRKALLPSGHELRFNNRLRWAMTYLRKAELISTPRRGVFVITDQGLQALDAYPERIDMKVLQQFPGYQAFKSAKRDDGKQPVPSTDPVEQTPEEVLAMGLSAH